MQSPVRFKSAQPIGLTSALLAVFGMAFSLHAQYQSDNFNDGNDNGWTHYDPVGLIVASITGTYVPFASWTVAGGAYRIQASPAPAPTQMGPARAGSLRSEVYTNFFISADVVGWDPTLAQDFGILARVQTPGPGTTAGYAFTWGPDSSLTNGAVDISYILNEEADGISLTGSDTLFLVPGHSYRFVFIGRGPNLEGRVYELPETNTPIVTVSGMDARYESGISGFVIYNGDNLAADATFDNFFVTDIEPPRLQMVDLGFGEFAVAWPLEAASYTLQTSGNPANNSWVSIPSNDPSLAVVGDQFYYYLPTLVPPPPQPPAPNAFYRLFRP